MKIKFEELFILLRAEDKKGQRTIDSKVEPTQNFVRLEEKLCEECTAEQIYKIAKLGLRSTNIKKLAKAIIARKDPFDNYMFAEDIPGVDIRAHGQVVIESKDPQYNYVFARDIPGADVLAHAQAIYKFSKDDKTAGSLLNLLNSYLKSEYNTELLFDDNGCPIEIDPIIDNNGLSKY